jgi:hypothetical protein
MTTGDEAVERTADKLGQVAQRAAARGGLAAKLAQPLHEDSVFLRKLKPSLVLARLRGEPTREPAAPAAPSGPQLRPRRPGGPNPIVIVAAAFAVGVVLAKLIEWRSHAHPRD